MLTDTKLRNLKPSRQALQGQRPRRPLRSSHAGRDNLFRHNYSISGRQETLTIGRYGSGGITLAEARELLSEAKKMIAAGKSPARGSARRNRV